jgi:hypothetical protein
MRELLLDVERNQKIAELKRRDYTYHLHVQEQELDGNGSVKKTAVTDSESLTIQGVRVDRVVARNGKPLTPDEAKKESERIDKDVAKAVNRRNKNEGKGEETDSRGDVLISAARILELGSFSNPRRVDFNGRPTIVADYAGDPNAKTHNSAEGIIRDLVGTVWIDERDRVLVQAQGHFLNDFKIGLGLVADVKKDTSFQATFTKVNDEVWLPSVFDGRGKIRILLVTGFTGNFHLVATDYRKFRASSTILGTNGAIGPDGQILDPPAAASPAPSPEPNPHP